jgi:hypothetical protein
MFSSDLVVPGTIKALQCSLRHFPGEARSDFGSWRVRQIDACNEIGRDQGLPVIELDKIFWQPGLEAMPHAE